MIPVFNEARQQNSRVQREEVPSRQDARNAKESRILFQPINDASDPLLHERLAVTIVHAHHALGARYERNIHPRILRTSLQ
jgi:hypothetical protein